MANEKLAVLRIGLGDYRSNISTNRTFSSAAQMGYWISTQTYTINSCVEYAGNVYVARVTTTGQQPDITPASWSLYFAGVTDADICYVVNSSGSADIQQRIAGVWESIGLKPTLLTLADNQVTPVSVFGYDIGAFKSAEVTYEITRPSGPMRRGKFTVTSNGLNDYSFSERFTLFSADPGVTLTPFLNGTFLEFQFTSTLMSEPVLLKYLVKGW